MAIPLFLLAHAAGAQSLPPVTTDPAAARHTMVQAAGMPLNDGALAPGMLTVRVVRGAFTADLSGQTVTVDVEGGRRETAQTGPDGRAMFAHLPVGSRVRVSALVENEPLASEVFALPADSGVRILLVVEGGQDGAAAGSEAGSMPPLVMPASAVGPAGTGSSRSERSSGVLAIRIFFTVATLAAFALVLFRISRPARPAGRR
jgi:hypothetical protein